MNKIKKTYTAPRLTVHGNATQVTMAVQQFGLADRAFGSPITSILNAS